MASTSQAAILAKVKTILTQYEMELSALEKEAQEIIFEYKGVLKQERISQLKKGLASQ